MTKIGVISDTHGLLRRETLRALEGCGLILHAGDVGDGKILEELAGLAPVLAVRGNADEGEEYGRLLPASADEAYAGLRICMAHKKKDLPRDLSGYDLAVYGHTHRFAQRRSGRTLFLNPGSCGPGRGPLPVTMAVLEVGQGPAGAGSVLVRRIDIPVREPAPSVSGRLDRDPWERSPP